MKKLSSMEAMCVWRGPDYLKFGYSTLNSVICPLLFCLQIKYVLRTCYISDWFEKLWVISMDMNTLCFYFQLIQFTVTTVNSQGLLYQWHNIHLNAQLKTYFCFPWSWMYEWNSENTKNNFKSLNMNKPQYKLECDTYFNGSWWFDVVTFR